MWTTRTRLARRRRRHKVNICSTVAAMTAGGSFDLDELAAHVAGCDECKLIVAVVVQALDFMQPIVTTGEAVDDEEIPF